MKNLGFTVRRARSGEEHIQTDLVILFLLEGEMTVLYHGESIPMRHEDILLINPGMNYELRDVRNALYAVASYSGAMLAEIMENRNLILYVDSVSDTMHSYQDIREILIDLTAEYTSQKHQTRARQDSLLLNLMDHLIENYQIQQSRVEIGESEADVRMRQMMQYILNHINEEISLSGLAEEMYVSTSTLSRIFRKKTGVYFADYVMQLRVKSSLGLLNYSDQNLTQIAMNCGFSNSSAYNRAFRKVMHMTPSEYREQNRITAEKEKEARMLEESRIRTELQKKGYQQGTQEHEMRVLLDLSKEKPADYPQTWNSCINVGALHNLTRANIQFHVLYLQEHLQISCVRLWNVFSIKSQVSDGSTFGQYNFDLINQALDFLVQHHIRPFLDLGRRPDTAIKTDGDVIYYNEEYIPFVSREIWEDIIYAFFFNIINRYGLEEVSSWTFELARDGFHDGPRSGVYQDPRFDFYQAWEYVYHTVRRMVPGAQVGGISSVIDHDREYDLAFYRRCAANDCIPDFASFLLFPYEFRRNEAAGPPGRYISRNTNIEEDRILQMRRLMDEAGISDRKLLITEWNNTIANRNFLNDSCFRSAYLVAKTVELWGKTDMMCVMSGTDWVSSYFDTSKVVNGGVGLLTKDTIRKPAFFALAFLNSMGSQYRARGSNYIVTSKENGDLYILFHHFSWFRQGSPLQNEEVDLEQVQKIRFEDEKTLKITLMLQHMEAAGEYAIKNRRLNARSGSILDTWRRFGFESELNREDVKYLQAVSIPEIEMQRETADRNGTLEVTAELEPQEVVLMHIYRRHRHPSEKGKRQNPV
ncbi:MAG: helix-turn-helix domain-containing protein [Lachnospiraceae bacterium]|jgi:AraC-like DNA-binding protein/beta-xylosidase|nr:helix-turn-helix domain-containing protein [Lachnospiraceae bacterium]MCI1657648.1 helix-turn-helix domain-containing protein [Lachnospiraceae bacterium]MCI2196063.1 helix-turn-helix domain-containing protein [Lachnospiraceae bacterium]